MNRGWIALLGAALLAGVLLVPAATGAGPFHSGSGTTKYVAKINGSTAPTIQCNAAGNFTTTVTARVDSPGSGSLTTDNQTDGVRVTVSPGSGSLLITAPNADVSGSFTLPCPGAASSSQVTFTFTPCKNQGGTCNTQTDLATGQVVATITNTASA